MVKQKLFWAIGLGSLSFVLLVTSVALAAPHQPFNSASHSGPSAYALITHTETITPTETVTPTDTISPTGTTSPTVGHPVAAALADYFEVTYAEIASLHQSGLGFGGIAHAYFMAKRLNEDEILDNDVTPEDLLLEFESGVGWGQIAKAHELHPGRRGRGGSLGDVMSGRWLKEKYKVATENDADAEETVKEGGKQHGPPKTPPGQSKNKDKGKDKGKGRGRNK